MLRALVLISLLAFSALADARLSVGDSAPNRLGKDAKSGEEVITPDYAGKITVVHFWASWCDYCFKTLPAMEAVQEQLGLANLQVVSVAFKDEPKTINKITAELKELSMISAIDKTGKVVESFGDDYMPNVWIIGRDGKIMSQVTVKDDEALKKAIKLIEAAIRAK
jgi:thiol-disulfide isomerase/thioredoxin